jgi:hypothetical protein
MARGWTLGMAALASLVLGAGATLVGQRGLDTVEASVNAARTAAGQTFPGLFERPRRTRSQTARTG